MSASPPSSEPPRRDRADEGTVLLRGGGYKALLATVSGVMVLCTLVMTLKSWTSHRVGWAGRIGVLPLDAVSVWWWVRIMRAQILLEPRVLCLRGMFRTRRLAWEQVASAEMVASNANRLFALIRVRTTDGRRIKVDGVGRGYRRSQRPDSELRRVAEAINSRATAPTSGSATQP